MFTGIIEEVGTVGSIRKSGKAIVLELKARKVLEGTRQGDSIAADGVCLTVTAFHDQHFTVDVMPETMNRTTFHRLKPGSRMNLERALRLSDRLGGHLVSGHIDGTGRILERRQEEHAEWLRIEAREEVMRYIVEKGSVAVDGISLTVAALDNRSFSVSIIPHTQSETTILSKRIGDEVNIECDIIGKYIEKLAKGEGKGSVVTLETLARTGFI
ncbi:MAG: riboflavin synthase [Bacteroidetes bacterium]|nr:MAG: riboflavin synthase [Bacteroidota bacterium]